jgi:hypothetical protein
MSSPSGSVDLRSDTVTRPSVAMRRVIAEAEVGDAVLGDDPTVAELERYAAGLQGKERALFLPSGIMANQTALLLLAPPGTEAVIEAGGHILNIDAWWNVVNWDEVSRSVEQARGSAGFRRRQLRDPGRPSRAESSYG